MKHKLFWVMMSLLAGMLVFWGRAGAQAPPDNVINPIIGDLGQRVGRNLTLDDLVTYSWRSGLFNNESIGCPVAGQEYTRTLVEGYIVQITYGGLFWDYRYDAKQGTFFLCNTPNLDRLVLPVTPTPRPDNTPTPAPTTAPVAGADTSTNPQPAANPASTGGALATGSSPCPQALTGSVPTRLNIGAIGLFVGTTSQNIHAEPQRSSQILGVTAPGASFSVLDGPQCDRTFTWWQVDTNGQIGWVGEVNPSDLSYWLEPNGNMTPFTGEAAPSAAPVANTASSSPTPAAAPVSSSPAADIAELARQTLTSPSRMTTGASTANPEGIVVIANEGGGINVYSQTSPSIPFLTRQENALGLALYPNGDTLVALLRSEQGFGVAQLGTAPEASGGASGLPGELNGSFAVIASLNLAALGTESGISFFDLGTAQIVLDYPLEAAPLALAAHPSNAILAVALPDQILLLEVNTQTELQGLPYTPGPSGAPPLAFSPDGALLAIGAGGGVQIYGATDFALRQTLSLYEGEGGEVYALAFSPDASFLAVGGNALPGGTNSSKIELWDANGGALLARMGGVGVDQFILGLAFSADGRLLNAISRDGLWQIWALP
jgi:hypothetical protein